MTLLGSFGAGFKNGWEQGSASTQFRTSQSLYLPFTNTVAINGGFGPTKNITQIDPQKEYEFSALVCPTSNNIVRLVVEPHKDNSGSVSGQSLDDVFSGLTVNKWQRVTRTISGAKLREWNLDGLNGDFLRIWVGCYPTDANKAYCYVEDIRFHPKKAHITTMYYDRSFMKNVMSIDENCNLSKKVKLDGFGRPIKIEKYDFSKDINATGFAMTTTEKKYHLRSDLPENRHIQILYPDGGENLNKSSFISIQWVNIDTARIVRLSYKKKISGVWSGWILDTTFYNHVGFGSRRWDVSSEGPAPFEYKILAEIPTVDMDSSDAPFIVSGPNTAPSAPVGISAAQGNSNSNTIGFSWSASTDAHGDPISYNVFVVGKGYVGQHITGTTFAKVFTLADQKLDPMSNPYEWYVEADDGELQAASATGTFIFMYHTP